MDRGDLGKAEADLILAEPRAFVPDDGLVCDLNDRGKKKVPARQPAGFEFFRQHQRNLIRKSTYARSKLSNHGWTGINTDWDLNDETQRRGECYLPLGLKRQRTAAVQNRKRSTTPLWGVAYPSVEQARSIFAEAATRLTSAHLEGLSMV